MKLPSLTQHSPLPAAPLRWLAGLAWAGGAAPVLAGLALLACLVAYQAPLHLQHTLTRGYVPLQLIDMHSAERTTWPGYDWQRWTQHTSSVVVPHAGGRAATLRLRLHGGASPEAGTEPRTLFLRSGGHLLAAVPVRPTWQDVYVALPATAANRWSGTLALDLEIAPLEVPGDRRTLGVALAELELVPHPGATLPPGVVLVQFAGIALLSLCLLRLVGLPVGGAVAVSSGLVVLLSGALAGLLPALGPSHLHGLVTPPLVWAVLLLALPVVLLVLVLTHRWGLQNPSAWAVAIRCAILFILVSRLVGMLHPAFAHVDHWLRLNQLVAIANGNAAAILPGLEQQHEWGTREPIPYTLVTYYLLVPLTWLWGGNETWFWNNSQLLLAMKLAVVLFDASVPLLVWAVLRHEPAGRAAAGWAALCYAVLPINYLFLHDGSFPTTMGVWVVLLALLAMQGWLSGAAAAVPPVQGWLSWFAWAGVVGLLAAALVAYVTHIVFVPMLLAALLASLYLLDRRPATRRAVWRLAAACGLALLLVWLLYYADYTQALIQRTIPAFLELLTTEGGVGQDPERFFGTPPKTFGEHVYAHFRVWVVLLAAMALVGLLVQRRRSFVVALGLGYAAVFVLTSLADVWFNLWNKHMYFAMPGFVLLAGLGLAWFWRRGWAGRLVCGGLLLYLAWESSLAWSLRVLWFEVPNLAF